MRRRPTRIVTVLLAIAALTVAAPAAAGARALLLSGSTSIYPLMIQLAAAYHSATHQPTPKIEQGTSDAGINEVGAGKVDIGDVSRDPIIGVDPPGLVFTKIARDGVCMITNPKNPLSNLSQEEVKSIFTGNVRDWSEVPGEDRRLDRPRRPRRLLRYPGRLPEHLPRRRTEDLPQRRGRGKQRPGAEQGAHGHERDRVRLVRVHRRGQRRRLPGHPLHAAKRQVRSVPGRA